MINAGSSTSPFIQLTPPGALARPGSILLLSCYELGHQPLSLAGPAGVLRAEGFVPRAIDLSIEELPEDAVRAARLVAISVPMHTAMRLGVRVIDRIRAVQPHAHITFFGMYALLNAEYLFAAGADSVIGAECEVPLRALAKALHNRRPVDDGSIAGLGTPGHPATAPDEKPSFPTPYREGLPALRSYAGFERDNVIISAGYVEATRGCHHTCTHCPVTPVYKGKLVVVPREHVLADIAAQVEAGARHITFGDPDFFNGPGHSFRILRAMHERWPTVSFDATIKIEHLLEHRQRLPELAELGCAFVVSAVETLNPEALRRMKKGHTADDVDEAIRLLDEVGIPMRPSLLPFSPWETLESYLDLLRFMAEHAMQPNVDPVHYGIRLLVPPGSAVLDDPDNAAWLGPLDAERFTYTWTHDDPRMETLQREVSRIAERGAERMEPAEETFAAIWQAAHAAAGISAPPVPEARMSRPKPPRLTESWFCCAEPTAEQFDAMSNHQRSA